jgi:hypothetical protein
MPSPCQRRNSRIALTTKAPASRKIPIARLIARRAFYVAIRGGSKRAYSFLTTR